jgi:uncharacterized protein
VEPPRRPYDRADLDRALRNRELIEFRTTIRPAEDLALRTRELIEFRKTIRPAEDLALRTRELPDTCAVPWTSTGWTNNKNVSKLLDFMVRRGEVAVAGRRGNDRLWDLAERVYPDVPVVPLAEASRRRSERRLAALGIARARGPECPVEPLDVGEAGEEAVVDGVGGIWRVDPSLLGQPFIGRAALLSPFDRLLHDRKRMIDLFEFDYILEMYKPAAKRRWGYFALPILYDDRLVGKLDATADRKAGVLRVHALLWDLEPPMAMIAAVDREIHDLAIWLELGR